jgi:hypothetical protein
MKRKFLFFIHYSLFLFACSSQQTELRLDGVCYTIDLDGKKEAPIPFSSIFKNVQTIILEAGKDCLIGSVDELQIFDGCIYILDKHIAKSLFVFDMEGRFIRKIGSLGRGPGEFIHVDDFTIDTGNRFIFLSDQGNRVHQYQLNGAYVQSIKVQAEHSNIMLIQFYNDRLYADAVAWDPVRGDYMLLEIDPDSGKILSCFPHIIWDT